MNSVIIGDQYIGHDFRYELFPAIPRGGGSDSYPFDAVIGRVIWRGLSAKGLKPKTNGRDDWIRTSDLTHPKRARYQAAPRPDGPALMSVSLAFEKGQDSEEFFVQIEEEFSLRA